MVSGGSGDVMVAVVGTDSGGVGLMEVDSGSGGCGGDGGGRW